MAKYRWKKHKKHDFVTNKITTGFSETMWAEIMQYSASLRSVEEMRELVLGSATLSELRGLASNFMILDEAVDFTSTRNN